MSEQSKLSADGLGVVAYEWSHEKGIIVHSRRDNPPFYPDKGGYSCEPLCRLTDAQRLLSQLREELAQRDAEIERLNERKVTVASALNHAERELDAAKARIASIESQQAASVGGDREAFEAAVATVNERGWTTSTNLARQIWDIRAALSPAGGGVVMPERQKVDHIWPLFDRGWNACLDEFARLNAKPQANSQEGSDEELQ